MRKKWIFIVPAAILGMALFAFIGGELVMHLWNWLVPTVIGWRQVTFWQALGLLTLCRILFVGFGWHGPSRSRFRGRMRDRCANMTEEEKEKFRQRMRERFGFGPRSDEQQATK